jgi:hypothetical protein
MKNENTQEIENSKLDLHNKKVVNPQVMGFAIGLLGAVVLGGMAISSQQQNQSGKLVPGSWSQLERDSYLNGTEPICGTYGCAPQGPARMR